MDCPRQVLNQIAREVVICDIFTIMLWYFYGIHYFSPEKLKFVTYLSLCYNTSMVYILCIVLLLYASQLEEQLFVFFMYFE
jgi:hypothetical protein